MREERKKIYKMLSPDLQDERIYSVDEILHRLVPYMKDIHTDFIQAAPIMDNIKELLKSGKTPEEFKETEEFKQIQALLKVLARCSPLMAFHLSLTGFIEPKMKALYMFDQICKDNESIWEKLKNRFR